MYVFGYVIKECWFDEIVVVVIWDLICFVVVNKFCVFFYSKVDIVFNVFFVGCGNDRVIVGVRIFVMVYYDVFDSWNKFSFEFFGGFIVDRNYNW